MIYIDESAIEVINEKSIRQTIANVGQKAAGPLTKASKLIPNIPTSGALKKIIKSAASELGINVTVLKTIKTGTPLTKEYAEVADAKDRSKLISKANIKAKEKFEKSSKDNKWFKFEPNKDSVTMIDVRYK